MRANAPPTHVLIQGWTELLGVGNDGKGCDNDSSQGAETNSARVVHITPPCTDGQGMVSRSNDLTELRETGVCSATRKAAVYIITGRVYSPTSRSASSLKKPST